MRACGPRPSIHSSTRLTPTLPVFSSPFRRALRTAVIASKVLDLPSVRVERGLTEWQTPALLGKDEPYLAPNIFALMETFGESVHATYESICVPTPWETEEAMIERTGRVARILADR